MASPPSVLVPCRRARKCTAAFTSRAKAAVMTYLHPLGKGLACIFVCRRDRGSARFDGRAAIAEAGYRSYSPLEGAPAFRRSMQIVYSYPSAVSSPARNSWSYGLGLDPFAIAIVAFTN